MLFWTNVQMSLINVEGKPGPRLSLLEDVGRYLSEAVIRPAHIQHSNSHRLFPRTLRFEFVDIASITGKHRGEIDMMKKHFGHHMKPGTVIKGAFISIIIELKLSSTALVVLNFSGH